MSLLPALQPRAGTDYKDQCRGAIGAVAIFYGIFWNYLAGQYRAGIEQWAELRRAEGVEVGFSSLRIVGFPLKLEALLSDPALSGADGSRTWTWRGPLMLLQARPWSPDRAQVRAPGRHRITVTGGTKPLDLAVDAGTLNVALRLRNGRPDHATVLARNIKVNDAAKGRIASLVRVEIVADQSGRLNVQANTINYPIAPVPGLGLKTARLGFKARVSGGLPATQATTIKLIIFSCRSEDISPETSLQIPIPRLQCLKKRWR